MNSSKSHVYKLMLVTSIALWSCSTSSLSHGSETGTLELTVLDAVTKEELPARIELQASDGKYYVASDGLLVGGDCDMSDEGAGLVDLQTTLDSFSRQLENPYRNSLQFYSEGKSSIELPEGTASIRIYKGPEYNAYQDTVDIQAGRVTQLRAGLTRWINMPAQGWYSSDDHLHIPRPVKELNPFISKMMQAEDIHVANLLQMGKVANFNIAKQYAHGRGSYYREEIIYWRQGRKIQERIFLAMPLRLSANRNQFSREIPDLSVGLGESGCAGRYQRLRARHFSEEYMDVSPKRSRSDAASRSCAFH